MGLIAQDERSTVASIEAKTRELKLKLDALGVFEQVNNLQNSTPLFRAYMVLAGHEEAERHPSLCLLRTHAIRGTVSSIASLQIGARQQANT